MKRHFLLAAVLALATHVLAMKQTLFDFGWQFTLNGKTTTVDLPHDWDIAFSPDAATAPTGTGGGWFPAGKGEYRKKFKTPDGDMVRLLFEGVYQRAEVFVNGKKAGQHAYGYTPFTVDMTPYLYKNKKQDNEVVVKVDNSLQPNCRWYSGSGIYRHVWLQALPAVAFEHDKLMVHTVKASSEAATVRVTLDYGNNRSTQCLLDSIEVEFMGGDFELTPQMKSNWAQQKPQTYRLGAGTGTTFHIDFDTKNPKLWSPATPFLYRMKARLIEKGRVLDECEVKFGIRTFDFDAQAGFKLNGQPMLINGACVHHDNGVLGAAAFDAAEVRKVKLMKEAGFNLIRTSHNPPSRAFLDACDSLGMLVIDEAFDGWRTEKNRHDYHVEFDSCCTDDVLRMVERDRRHPSIICWSIGNEVIERKEIRVVSTARMLKRCIKGGDPEQRPVTEALCAWDRDWEIYDPHAEVLDVVGYNYMIFKHDTDHKRDPKRVMWQTESYPRDAFRNWAYVHDFPYIVGDMVWTGLDYLGESGIGRYYYKGEREGESYAPGGQPEWHGAYCGDVDITGWRKPISHYREMLWNEGTKLYMAVREPNNYRGEIKGTQWSVWPTWESWNWAGWEGKPIEVEVYTKQPEVSLYLNDQLVETKKVGRDTEFKARFTLPYQPGTLRAVAAGEETTLKTAGKPAALRLKADRTVMAADGQDLSYVTLEVVDEHGLVVPDAAIDCEVALKGQGRLMGVVSADLKDTEPATSPRVKTWKGRAIMVVRSSQKRGSIGLTVKSQLPTATLQLSCK